MNCPTCKTPLPAGQGACPTCFADAPPVEGALAPDLSRRPARPAVEPLRELPGKRRRERTWKDEVRERVDRRRQEVRGEPSSESDLPLFPEGARETPAPRPPAAAPRAGLPARRAERRPARPVPAPPVAETRPATTPAGADTGSLDHATTGGPSVLDVFEPQPADPRAGARLLGDVSPHVDLDAVDLHAASRLDPRLLLEDPPPLARPPLLVRRDVPPPDDLPLRLGSDEVVEERERARPAPALALDAPPEEDWPLEAPRAASEPRPLERPARALERVQAAVIDAGLLIGLAALVVYFAGRVAQVPLAGLRPAWPFLSAYLVFLGLVYASYFTGTTGQTVGKILLGLRVVDTTGHAPGYSRALLRGILGALGTLAAGLGLVTVLFDPARRALHDRLLHTRVISVRRG